MSLFLTQEGLPGQLAFRGLALFNRAHSIPAACPPNLPLPYTHSPIPFMIE